MNITSSIKEKIRLYGFWGMMQRVFKSIIYAVFKIKWEKCYLMSRTVEKIDYSLSEKGIEVRELKMEDYDSELWITYLTEEKKDTLQKRFKTKNTKGYGVFVNGVLACSGFHSELLHIMKIPYCLKTTRPHYYLMLTHIRILEGTVIIII